MYLYLNEYSSTYFFGLGDHAALLVVLLALGVGNLPDDAVEVLFIIALHDEDGGRSPDGAVASDLALELTLLFSKAVEVLVGMFFEGLSASVVLELTDEQHLLDAVLNCEEISYGAETQMSKVLTRFSISFLVML